MSELHIAGRLIEERHKKKITQEAVAMYLGVSKAAVSKWESGQSFPDITLLPQLAAFFNISIDELMGYEPQMTKEDIKRHYQILKKKFGEEPFEEVIQECEELIKKYYSCFPFLLQMAVLLVNHGMLSQKPEDIYRKAVELTERVRTEGEDVNDAKEAVSIEVACLLLLREPMRALDLMDETVRPIVQDTEILAQIYQSMGKEDEAKKVFQIGMYQHLIALLNSMVSYMMLYAKDYERVETIIERAISLGDLFEVDFLHPNTMANIYLATAQVFCIHDKTEKALDMIQRYAQLCTTCFFPFHLHGDAYFDQIDDWFLDFDIGNGAPRSERLIKESMLRAVKDNPFFIKLQGQTKFQRIVEELNRVRD